MNFPADMTTREGRGQIPMQIPSFSQTIARTYDPRAWQPQADGAMQTRGLAGMSDTTTLILGAAVIGGVVYFASRKKRRR